MSAFAVVIPAAASLPDAPEQRVPYGVMPMFAGTPAAAASPGVAAAGPAGCTGRRRDGAVCAGRAGEDGRCAVHKDPR